MRQNGNEATLYRIAAEGPLRYGWPAAVAVSLGGGSDGDGDGDAFQ